MNPEQKGRPVFTRQDMKSVSLRRKWVPLWEGKWGCVFEPTVSQRAKWTQEARLGGEWDDARFTVAAFIDCVRDGDQDDSRPIFNREQDWGWLMEQSDGVIQNAVEVALRLGMPDREAIERFFGKIPEGGRKSSSEPSA